MISIFRNFHIPACSALFGALLLGPANAATSTTPGIVNLTATLNDFAGSTSSTSGQRHDTVVWVTKADGTFIKTLWKQGPAAFDDEDWVDHFAAWNTARAGSTAFDGFTSATAQNYNAPNNPVSVTWNCKDASNNRVEDGVYKFFIQYAESKNLTVGGVSVPEQGPVTTELTWTKGPANDSQTLPNQGTYSLVAPAVNNFTNLSINWIAATVAPAITSSAPPSTGSMGTPYAPHSFISTGSAQITYAVTSGALPTGLTLTSNGLLSGTPLVAGTFSGTITAENGVLPNAVQPFSITIAEAIVFTSTPPPVNGNLATAYSHTSTVIGTAPLTYSLGSGALPPGLTLSTDGVISGKPTSIGTYIGKIKAHNGIVTDVTQDFSITVSLATEGTVTLNATINEYTGTTSTSVPATQHDVVVWVTDASGKFIKTLWKQGPASFTHRDWTDHFAAWTTARAGSVALDGFTSATARDYSTPVNNPIAVTWNCRDANGNLVDDGNYKFFIQYGEHQSGTQGPVTSGLTWTKGLAPSYVTLPAEGTQGAPPAGNNFTAMSIQWSMSPEIVVEDAAAASLVDGQAATDFGPALIDTVSAPVTFTIRNTGSADLSGLAVLISGDNASDFTIVTPPVKTKLTPWTSATFSVAFKPSGVGSRTASLQIVSNDPDESPFEIQLTGKGTPPPAPEIAVMQPATSNLTSKMSKRNFGTVEAGSKKGKALTFTIKNTGNAPLTGLKIMKIGSDLKAFVVSDLSATTLAAGGSTTFKVTFKPSTKGSRHGGIRIVSNDADENPFEIIFAGQSVKPKK